MKNVNIKIFLILFLLVPVPFGCKDDPNAADELRHVLPYWQMQGLVFDYLALYTINAATGKPLFLNPPQDFENPNRVFPADRMALYIITPDTFPDGRPGLIFLAQNNPRSGFSFIQEAFANRRQPGYRGTRDLVSEITISSNFDFSETHTATMDMSDIVEIFAYTTSGEFDEPILLREFNRGAPREAPKRFWLLIDRPARLSPVQQFVIRYFLHNEQGEASRYFEVVTPVFNVEVR